MEVIPAIDLIDQQVVRLKQGDYQQQTTYKHSPVDLAKHYEDCGAKRLHLVDLDAAKGRESQNKQVLKQITEATSLSVDYSGGIRTRDDLLNTFEHGAKQVVIGTLAIREESLFQELVSEFSDNKIILACDVYEEEIAISAWEEKTKINIFDFLKQQIKVGIQEIICTAIKNDGLLSGPDLTLYQKIKEQYPDLKLIASGGISKAEDFNDLCKINVDSVVVGKALLEGKITDQELKSCYV